MIESYRFGEVVVDGRRFTTDILILHGGSVSSWWRREGHVLNVEDLKDVMRKDLEVLVIGTGSVGLMSVPQATLDYVSSRGVDLVVERTEFACNSYNSLLSKKRVAAALHLTC